MSGRKGGQRRAASPGAPLLSPRQYRSGASSSRHTPNFGAGGRRATLPAVSAVPSSVHAPQSMPAPGPVCPATGSTTFMMSPVLLAAMEKEPLLIPDLPPPLTRLAPFSSIGP